MPGRNGHGGPGEQRIVVDPRAAYRARQRRLAEGDPISAPPPSLLPDPDEDPDRIAVPYHWHPDRLSRRPLVPPPVEYQEYPGEDIDPVQETLRLRFRPGRSPDRTARVRVYHRLRGAPEGGFDGRCWAFTITRGSYERLLTERVLDSEGATYPDGERVVPPGVDPLYVPLRCGSCGTDRIECLQLECWQD